MLWGCFVADAVGARVKTDGITSTANYQLISSDKYTSKSTTETVKKSNAEKRQSASLCLSPTVNLRIEKDKFN